MLRDFFYRIIALLQKSRLDREMHEEMQFHLERETEEHIRKGMSEEQARFAALKNFGGVLRAKEMSRDERSFRPLADLAQDMRYGLRMLRKNPSFTIVAVLTLALGIGINSAMFSVINGVLLRPLPFSNPDQLVAVFGTSNSTGRYSVLPFQLTAWQERNRVFASMAGYTGATSTLIPGDGQPVRVRGLAVTSDFLKVLGVEPLFGRSIMPEENHSGQNKVVILSHSLWQKFYNYDPHVIEKTIRLDGEIYNIIGVLPESFRFIEEVEVMTPVSLDISVRPGGQVSMPALKVIARMKDGINLREANVEMLNITHQPVSPSTPQPGAEVISLHDLTVENSRAVLLILCGAVAFVLLIACANVANLNLARGAALSKELAIRSALGASRMRIIRLLSSQSLLLAFLGGATGLLLASWGIKLLLWLSPATLPRINEIGIDWRVLIFTLIVSLLSAFLFGLMPALKASQVELTQALKEGSQTTTGSSGFARLNFRGVLIIAEFALALMLMVGAGLLINSFVRLLRVDLGFQPENVLTFSVSLPETYRDKQQVASFYHQALTRLRALPGVTGVAVVNPLPLGNGAMQTTFQIEGEPVSDERLPITQPIVSSDYFRVMGISLLRGRFFSERDENAPTGVVNINEEFARRFLATPDPIGKRVSLYQNEKGKPVWMEIAGVVGNVRQEALTHKPEPVIYLPHTQLIDPSMMREMTFVLKTTIPPATLSTAIRGEILAIDREIPVIELKMMRDVVAANTVEQRFITVLLGAFAALATILAGIGIYGVVSTMVAQRTHEIGIRMALGAQRSDVFKLVLGQGMRLVSLGIGIGLIFSIWMTRILSNMLYDLSPRDPFTFVLISFLLSSVALIACYLPARRAVTVDPLVALRYE